MDATPPLDCLAWGALEDAKADFVALQERIRLRRTKGWRMSPGARVVTRSTAFGNP